MSIFVFKNISRIIIIFVIGIFGGIFADQILWPYFIERPLFYQYRLEQGPINVTETKEITIEENTALQEAVGKVSNSVIGIRGITKQGKILEGSGVVVSSDGLILALSELVPDSGDISIYIDSIEPDFEVIKRDTSNNLVLIKIEETNLATIGFAQFEELKLGQRAFLLSVFLEKDGLKNFVNEGIIKTFDDKWIKTNIIEKENILGSPLFNIKGELIGMNMVDRDMNIISIPISKIKEFAGF